MTTLGLAVTGHPADAAALRAPTVETLDHTEVPAPALIDVSILYPTLTGPGQLRAAHHAYHAGHRDGQRSRTPPQLICSEELMDPHRRTEHIPRRRSSHHRPSLTRTATNDRCDRPSRPAAGTVAADITVHRPRRTGHAEPRDLP